MAQWYDLATGLPSDYQPPPPGYRTVSQRARDAEVMQKALVAIIARLDGDLDNGALEEIGPMMEDVQGDIRAIAVKAIKAVTLEVT